MPSYLWPMTSLCPVLAGYRLVRSGPCTCLPSMYVQKSACCSLIRRGLEACLHSLSFVLWPFMWVAFWFPIPLRGWYLFITRLSFGPFLDCPHFLPYYSVIHAVMTQSCRVSLGLPFILWPFMWVAFWFLASLRGWYLFITGLYTSFGLFLDCPHFLPYYSVVFAVMTQSCWAFLGLPFTLSPSALTWPLVFLLMGSCVPFVFSLGHP